MHFRKAQLGQTSASMIPIRMVMKFIFFWLVTATLAFSSATDDFIAAAKEHGQLGEKAAKFLVANMPKGDRETLTSAFLVENLDLALTALKTFPWAKRVPEEIFLNDVLPYAVFDEPRDPWRADFLKKATPIVQGARTATEAAQRLNREFFKLINTHYNTGRKRPNQSPSESINQGKCTCTGLAIVLVDACRAVGIPARAVGTPMWSNGRGNHTWVEIWDGGWHFTGADEYDPQGLDRGWFTGDAAMANATIPENAIYATSWDKSGGHFPLVWAPESQQVGGVNITSRYVVTGIRESLLGIRYFDGSERCVVKGELIDHDGMPISSFETKAGTSDLNDMPRVKINPGQEYRLRIEIDGTQSVTQPFTAKDGESTRDLRLADLQLVTTQEPALSKGEADIAIQNTFKTLVEAQKKVRVGELDAKAITQGDKTLKWLGRTFGIAPPDGRSLWISMHGGGNAPAAVNDQQWRNQIRLYQPEEGIYVAPRAPTDTWNLWHEAHIDPLFSRLIEDMIALRGVNPNKIYLMGYSAGGDGVWQLAPRMADRFAAAAMMAGHPGDASLLPLRNLPFAIFVGGADAAYGRNKIDAEKANQLDALHTADPEGYIHFSRVYEGLPHWMNGKDAEALPWMEKFTRNPWPRKIIWVQDDVTHDRFYWLQIPKRTAKVKQQIIATVTGQNIELDGDVPTGIKILLSDELLDLDRPIKVTINDQPSREFKVTRQQHVIREALTNRLDPAATPTAEIEWKTN